MTIVNGNLLDAKENIIMHQVNCQGVMGSGVAKQIKEKYPSVYAAYSSWCKEHNNNPHFLLGSMLPVATGEDGKIVLNLFAQEKYGRDKCYTDYGALRRCLQRVNFAYHGCSLALPYGMSCGLGGGDWRIVAKIIEEELKDCDVYVYKLTIDSK